jgi:hypothetical protein
MRPDTYVHSLFHGYYFQDQSTITKEVITKETNSHIIYTGRTCVFLTSAAIMGVQMGEISLNRPLVRLYLCSLVCTSKGLLFYQCNICHNHSSAGHL